MMRASLKQRSLSCFALALLLAAAGCVSRVHEPRNLSASKAELVRYHDSGAYERALSDVAVKASEWIKTRAARRAPGERLAVVFDVDETLLSNWESMKQLDFGYVPERWESWVERAGAKAIAPVGETYRAARLAGVAVIFLTGRDEHQASATERNLRQEGFGDFDRLIVRTADHARTSAVEFKTAVRRALVTEGWTIIANVGDQKSDLIGGYAERTFKLPNPFYLTE
jgi:predicted secreted acid phosphatase